MYNLNKLLPFEMELNYLLFFYMFAAGIFISRKLNINFVLKI